MNSGEKINIFAKKKINSHLKNWPLLLKSLEKTSKISPAPNYCNLYAYAANNPLRYIDPDGKTVRNKTKQYVVVRLESDKEPCHYMILAPGDFITADCDGVIFSNSVIIKVSAKEEWKATVNITIFENSFLGPILFFDDIQSACINYFSDACKKGYNMFVPFINAYHFFTDKKYKNLRDLSGTYIQQNIEGMPLYSWWKGIEKAILGTTQERWKETYETNEVQKELQQKYLRKE